METYLSLPYDHRNDLPDEVTNDVRTPESLVEHFLEEYTVSGDRVIDIFAGYGTTLTVAERLDRVPYGLEYEGERVNYVRQRLATPDHVRRGDALALDPSWFPPCDCCITSPPFMERTDTRNPFQNYSGQSDYQGYLEDIETAFTCLDRVLTPGGTVIVDIVNMKFDGRVTTLAWDVAQRLSNVFQFDGEIVVTWTGDEKPDSVRGQYGYGYDHSYCLVFSKDPE